MKRLLVEGIGDCFQLAHVFRDGEYGKKHNPEFMMAEWYRLNIDFDSFRLVLCLKSYA
jgi:lysyl-tRNA synthetase class 2